MSVHHRPTEAVYRDLLMAWRCERFADTQPIEAVRELRRERGEWV